MALIVIEVFISRQRDVGEQRAHVADVRDRDADLADLAAGQDVVGVVAGLRRQVEGDRQPGLPLGEVAPVQLVGLAAPMECPAYVRITHGRSRGGLLASVLSGMRRTLAAAAGRG